MDIDEFFSNYKNHPVLFIGTGFSLRYLENSYTWDNLLKTVIFELYENDERYWDIKAKCQEKDKFNYEKIGSDIEEEFNNYLIKNRYGKFEEINDIFYESMKKGLNLSRFKIFIAKKLENLKFREERKTEILEVKKIRKNIGSIITTNYDLLIEKIFEFEALIGNDILLSNPYGSVYKIHGCVTEPSKIIITAKDYSKFEKNYELIRAQLLSLFIHNPIIFIGYSIGDENIKNILKTIFTYVAVNTPEAEKIRKNFLLIEHESNSTNREVVEHDIDIEEVSTIRINKLKTDDFISVYKSLANLHLPISAMDVRKVQAIVHEIYSGGAIKVHFTEAIDSLKNSDKIIAIGSNNTITYTYQTVTEMIEKYFNLIDESNTGAVSLIDKHKIQAGQYFPIFGFSHIKPDLLLIDKLKKQQNSNLERTLQNIKPTAKTVHNNIQAILDDTNIAETYKTDAILWAMKNCQLNLEEVEIFLREYPLSKRKETPYRKMLCMYDLKRYDNL